MNKLRLITTTFLLFAASIFSFASNMSFDESEIYSAFDEISEVSQFIETNNASYSDLEANNYSTSNIMNTAAIASSMQDEKTGPPILSAFWWGCLTGPIGIVVVAVTTDNNKEQIKKSVFGCAIPVGCSALSYALYYGLYIAAANSVY
ncbi:MAG: hypothetical protein PF486_04485 [Prolixibacteraceae bacterium]|jgi:hypothetical protein|nr:hypothetical protein [Prolixibacteraceae bacterium]